MDNKKECFYTARGYEKINKNNKLTPSMEDYIEMIYRLSLEMGYVRVNNLANNLNIKPPSVSKMVKKLKNKNLIKFKKYGVIYLTNEGKSLGKYFIKRHNLIKEFLILIGAKKEIQKGVEAIEHYINFHNYKVLKRLVFFLKEHKEVLKQLHDYKINNNIKKELD